MRAKCNNILTFICFTASKPNEEGYMAGLYLIQVTILICLIACVDGQALYEEICVNKIVNEMHQFYGK